MRLSSKYCSSTGSAGTCWMASQYRDCSLERQDRMRKKNTLSTDQTIISKVFKGKKMTAPQCWLLSIPTINSLSSPITTDNRRGFKLEFIHHNILQRYQLQAHLDIWKTWLSNNLHTDLCLLESSSGLGLQPTGTSRKLSSRLSTVTELMWMTWKLGAIPPRCFSLNRDIYSQQELIFCNSLFAEQQTGLQGLHDL